MVFLWEKREKEEGKGEWGVEGGMGTGKGTGKSINAHASLSKLPLSKPPFSFVTASASYRIEN